MDALALAVSWRNPRIVLSRLQASPCRSWKDDLALPLETALETAQPDVLKVQQAGSRP